MHLVNIGLVDLFWNATLAMTFAWAVSRIWREAALLLGPPRISRHHRGGSQ